MVREGLLDLDNRKNKAPGAYCSGFPASKQPFVFGNSVGVHANVDTVLHDDRRHRARSVRRIEADAPDRHVARAVSGQRPRAGDRGDDGVAREPPPLRAASRVRSAGGVRSASAGPVLRASAPAGGAGAVVRRAAPLARRRRAGRGRRHPTHAGRQRSQDAYGSRGPARPVHGRAQYTASAQRATERDARRVPVHCVDPMSTSGERRAPAAPT
jgi:hypothetical protein